MAELGPIREYSLPLSQAAELVPESHLLSDASTEVPPSNSLLCCPVCQVVTLSVGNAGPLPHLLSSKHIEACKTALQPLFRQSITLHYQRLLLNETKNESTSQPAAAAHSCEYCSVCKPNELALLRHQRVSHGTQARVCEVCRWPFFSYKRFKEHCAASQCFTNDSKWTAQLTCSYCGVVKSSAIGLLKHTFLQHEQLVNYCLTNSLRSKDLQCAWQQVQSAPRPRHGWLCPRCCTDKHDKGHRFMKPLQLMEHFMDHDGFTTHCLCALCLRRFCSLTKARQHYRNLHRRQEEPQCTHCRRMISSWRGLLQHEELCSRRHAPRHVKCTQCGRAYTSMVQLKRHIAYQHATSRHKCQECSCNAAFANRYRLRLHVLTEHRSKHQCSEPDCTYETYSKSALLLHERTTHQDEKPFSCQYCSYRSALIGNLQRHRRVHTGSRPYHCPHCKFRSNTFENLKKHVMQSKRHAGKFLFNCRWCSWADGLAANARDHVLSEHAGVWEKSGCSTISQLLGIHVIEEDRKDVAAGELVLQKAPKKAAKKVAPKKVASKKVSSNQEALSASSVATAPPGLVLDIPNTRRMADGSLEVDMDTVRRLLVEHRASANTPFFVVHSARGAKIVNEAARRALTEASVTDNQAVIEVKLVPGDE